MKKTIMTVALFISSIVLQCVLASDVYAAPAIKAQFKTWEGFSGWIVADGESDTYPYQVAYIEDNTRLQATYNVMVSKNGVKLKDETITGSQWSQPVVHLDYPTYPEFTGSKNHHGRIFKILGNLYGQWYIRYTDYCWVKFCFHALFIPNAAEINNTLNDGDVVRSTFTFRLLERGRVKHQAPLTVTISRMGLSGKWNDDVPLTASGDAHMTFDPDKSEDDYPTLTANISAIMPSGEWLLGWANDNLNGHVKGGASNKRADQDGARLPSGFSREHTRVYGSGWSNGSGRLRGGIWFFDELNSIVAFRPDISRIRLSLNPSERLTTSLILRFRNAPKYQLVLSVAIFQLGVSGKWDEPASTDHTTVNVNDSGDQLSIEYGSEFSQDGNPYYTASLSVANLPGDWFIGWAGEKDNGAYVPSASNKKASEESQETRDLLPDGFVEARTRVYGTGWSNGSGKINAGIWFFDERNYRVAFRPDLENMERNLSRVQSLETFLTLQMRNTPSVKPRFMFKVKITKVGTASQMSIDDSGPIPEGDDSGNTPMEFTINLTPAVPLGQPFSVPVTFAHGTTDDADFFGGTAPVIKPVNFSGTDTSKKVTVMVNRDNFYEPDETFTLTMGVPTGAAADMNLVKLSPTTVGTGTIGDDDSPTVSVIAENESVNEGEAVRFFLNSNPKADLNNVNFSISQQGEYIVQPLLSRADIVAGEATVSIDTIVDSAAEADGMITFRILEGTGYELIESERIAQVAVKNTDIVDSQRFSVAGSAINSILTQQPPDSPQLPDHDSQKVPEISIVALKSMVNEGSLVRFRVESSETLSNRLIVDLRIDRTGEITGGNTTVSVAMEPGERTVPLEVATHDDDLAGSDGRLTAMVVDGDGYRIGLKGSASVVISDERDRLAGLNRTALPEIAASIGTRTLDATGERVLQAFSGDSQTGLELAGRSSIREVLELGSSIMNKGEIDWNSLLGGSSVSVALYPEEGGYSMASLWGVGYNRDLSGNGTGHSESWKGNLLTGHLGFDAIVGQGMLAGVAASRTHSDLEIGETGEVESLLGIRSTGIHPYFGFESSNGGTQVRMTAGYGISQMDIDSDRYSTAAMSGNFHTFGVKGNRRLFAGEELLFGGHPILDMSGEYWMAEQSMNAAVGSSDPLQAVANHMRMAFEGTHVQELAAGHKISPSISIGMRRDGRDGLTTYGYELGSGVNYGSTFGISADASVFATVAELNQLHEWELKGSMEFDSGNDGLGVLASMQPAWSGTEPGERKFLWGSDILNVSDSSGIRLDGARVDSEFGYGFTAVDGSWTLVPYFGVRLSEENSNKIKIGTRFNTVNGINFEIEGSEVTGSLGSVSNSIKLTGDISW